MADELAFRRLVVSVSDQLSDDEVRKIVYTRLYTQRERLKDADRLEVICALEYRDVFSPAKPEGLLDIVGKDLRNRQLANFIAKELKKITKRKGETTSNSPPTQPALDRDSSPDSHLRMCYSVALAQANVLLQQLEVLRHAVEVGAQQRDKANEAIEGISNVASDLARRLRRSCKEFGLPRSVSGSSAGSTTGDETSTQAQDYEQPLCLLTNAQTRSSPPPPPRPKAVPETKLPQQETCDHDSLLSHSSQRYPRTGSEQWSTPHPRSPRSIRYAKQGSPPIPRDRHSSLPGNQVLPRTPPPAVPPRRRGNQQVPPPGPPMDEGEYQVLQPDLEQDGSADSGMCSGGTGSGDGGFTDARRYRKPPVTPRTVGRQESPGNRHSYKPLDRNTLDELLEYTVVNRKPV